MTPQELLEQNGIRLKDYQPGNHSTVCPECSHTRSRANQKKECLSIRIDSQGATWYCHHCGWSGPGKGQTNNGRARGQQQQHQVYIYHAADGTPSFRKVRGFDKNGAKFFWIERADGKGGWIKGTKDKNGKPLVDTSILYRLPEVIEAMAAGHTILVVEGEKDVDRLWSIGIAATTSANGAADPLKNQKPKWKPEHSAQLAGADIVVIPDHDNAGYAHADATCQCSLGVCKRVRRLVLRDHWSNCPKGGDVSDYLDAGHTREALDALIDQALDYAPGASKAYAPGTKPRKAHGGEDLKLMIFAPIKYVVPSVIVEGLTILAGKPKLGKSWLMLHAAIAVARGGFTLGNIHCVEGDVLYCSLEDNQRRLQSRMTKLLGIVPDWPKRFQYFTLSDDFPRLNNGGLDWLKEWIDSVPEPRLIVIDTFITVRAPKKGNQPNYDADYESGKELQKLANERGIAIVIVHHLRKADAEDAFDTVNATLGLTAVVDTVLVLKRETSGGVTLFGRGRDLVEIEKGMEFNKNACTWTIVGDAATIRLTKERAMILDALKEAASVPIGPREIAIATGMKEGNVRFLLHKMHKEGLIKKAGYGKYQV